MMHHHDNIHGVLAIPEDIACIIRSPQFQRLKHIKQLGFLYLYLPNASYSRFEHCIGTYWLARVMLACLRKNSDWLLDDKDFKNIYAKAVEIAALLHDIGHGPFSHAWEHIAEDFHHEMNGIACVDAIFDSQPPNFMPELKSNQNFGIELIKALILGDKSSLPQPIPSKYEFIFEIVNNTQCNIDVDKWDYLTRDSHYLSNLTHPPINFKDVFLNARVSIDGSRIEYSYADYSKIYEIFQARFILHKKYYRLPPNLAIERLMKRMIERSNPKLHGCDIRKINAKHSMGAFIKLTDHKVMQLVKNDKDYIYMEEPRRLKLVDEFTTDQLDLDLQSKYLIVEDTLQGPGVEMPQDHKFRFYGDKSEKAEIIRDITPIRTKYVFRIA